MKKANIIIINNIIGDATIISRQQIGSTKLDRVNNVCLTGEFFVNWKLD